MKRFLSVFTMIMSCIAGASSAATRSIIPEASIMTHAGLPTEEMAKTLLSAGLMYWHPQWIDIPAGSTTIHSFAIFPDGRDTAPVVVITANGQAISDWLRAVGDQAAQEGFIAVVPEQRTEKVTQYALNMPAWPKAIAFFKKYLG